MITRRKLLAFLGLGGAAAAVASKVEALGETNGAARCTDAGCGVAIEHAATPEAHEMRVATYEPTISDKERERLLDQLRNLDASSARIYEDALVMRDRHEHRFDMLTNRCSCGAERQYFGTVEYVEYAGPMLEDMPLIDLNDHRTPADFEHVALFAPEPEPPRFDWPGPHTVSVLMSETGHVYLFEAAHPIALHEPVGLRPDGIAERWDESRADLQRVGRAVQYDWSPERRFRS